MVTGIDNEDQGGQLRSLLAKSPRGITGFDEITYGGLRGRPSLVCGPPGAGTSVFEVQLLVNGVTRYAEPGVFLAFEQTRDDLITDVSSLNIDLAGLERDGGLLVDALAMEPQTIETGEFDLEALMVRLSYAVEKVGAKRVAIDNVEALFTTFSSPVVVRSELRRLFRWPKDHGLTTVITSERGHATLTRNGLEEYLSDCVVILDDRVIQDVATRRLRIMKYRGSPHGRNEYPFFISANGLEVLPITSLSLSKQVSAARVSTGVLGLDEMLGGHEVFRGSGVLVCGSSGTGKTTIAASFADAACRRGEVVLFFSFEESESEINRNLTSIGTDLGAWADQGLLHFHCEGPTNRGLEDHLAIMQRLIQEKEPALVVIDPVSSLARGATAFDVSAMLMRQVYYLKSAGITAVLTVLTEEGELAQSVVDISSLVDTAIELVVLTALGERNRALFVLKSRGTAHSNQVREFLLSDTGIDDVPVIIGANGVLTGSARITAGSAERATSQALSGAPEELARELQHRREAFDHNMATLRGDFASQERLTQELIQASQQQQEGVQRDRLARAAPHAANAEGPAVSVSSTPQPHGRTPTAERVPPTPFVSGASAASSLAVRRLRDLCDRHHPSAYDLEILDIYQQPEAVVARGVLAVPTLIRDLPLPVPVLIGDFADETRVLAALGGTSAKPKYL